MAGSSFRYTTDMAHEKVDAKLLGFKINDAQTNKTGDAETFSLTAPWEIAENSRLPHLPTMPLSAPYPKQSLSRKFSPLSLFWNGAVNNQKT